MQGVKAVVDRTRELAITTSTRGSGTAAQQGEVRTPLLVSSD